VRISSGGLLSLHRGQLADFFAFWKDGFFINHLINRRDERIRKAPAGQPLIHKGPPRQGGVSAMLGWAIGRRSQERRCAIDVPPKHLLDIMLSKGVQYRMEN